ncbi:MAG: Hsp70 family protein [Alphaproteobacteria bacterium]|nr:Hsp70 family protein [Alphaproteobacteria bacterium]MBV9693253.1 Hsp70 family protein [Alphaproteobacteria bacterium]
MRACGLDFGTSNSTIGILREGRPTLAPLEGESTLMPSAVFFDYEARGRVLYGGAAVAAYVGQTEGRLMRALKSILASPLIDEKTALGTKMVALTDVIELFIRHLKQRVERFAGEELSHVVHGRPVRFVDDDKVADRKAQSVLEAIARRAGFREVSFEFEPIAAAYHYEETAMAEEIVLIADIGGGTSDFSVVRIGPERRGRADRSADILANDGARIGGTDFDARLSLDAVMPLLGLGTQLRTKDLPMPKSLYYELATWSTINFAYTWRNVREVRELVADACEPEKAARLLVTLRRRLGHRIALSVEDAKIGLSGNDSVMIDLSFLDATLCANATRAGFEAAIHDKNQRLTALAARCINDAGMRPDAVSTIFFTGGSSRVPAVRKAIAAAAPAARIAGGSDFLSVGLGLTREAQKRYG